VNIATLIARLSSVLLLTMATIVMLTGLVKAEHSNTDIFWDGPDVGHMYQKSGMHVCSPGNAVAMIGTNIAKQDIQCVTLPSDDRDDGLSAGSVSAHGMLECDPGMYMIGMYHSMSVLCAHNPSIHTGANHIEHGSLNTRFYGSDGQYIYSRGCNEIADRPIMVLTAISADGKTLRCAPIKSSTVIL
jgi:hypothetical protein